MRAFRVAYDGRPFAGFQRQPDASTVEGALFDALADLDVTGGGAPPGYAAAGRTDAGVSAVAQTVAFECPDWLSPAALNGALPASVRAWASADVPAGFHATHDAVRRRYVYHRYAPDADADRASDAAAALSGDHDFHNLTPDETGTVRTLDADCARDGDFLVVRVSADGFARHLVRRLVSLVAAVADGASDLDRVDRVLSADSLDGPEGVPTAPPTPLVLAGVDYPGVAFETDPAAVESLRGVFGERRVDGLVAARVADTVLDGADAE
ncbi:MAG: tRNA pseudouridine(38-40) synthase TruA [Haloplanus sp.]